MNDTVAMDGRHGVQCEKKNSQNPDPEHKRLRKLRQLVEREDPSSKEVDDLTLGRFLRARDHNVEKASSMFLRYLQWRREEVPKGFISREEITNELNQQKICMQGVDKKGRPISVAFAARHFSSNRDLEEFKRYVVYFLDKICSSMPVGQEKFTAIGDVKGWGYANCDIRAYLSALNLLQDFYPERLGKLFIVNVPYLFWTAWKVVYPFIDKNTKKKIVFVEGKNLKAALLEDIDEDQLPQIYGGKLPLVPI